MNRDEGRESKMDHHESGRTRGVSRRGFLESPWGGGVLAANEEKPLHAVDVMAEAMKIR